MTTQSISYCTTEILPCETCLPSDVVFCVPDVLTANQSGFIEASLISFLKSNYCGVVRREYTFEYDDAQLEDPNTPLLTCEISGVFCKDCMVNYLQSVGGGGLIGWVTDVNGNFIQVVPYHGEILYNHEIHIFSNDNDGSFQASGGSGNSLTGAGIALNGVGAGGEAKINGAFTNSGHVSFRPGTPGAKIRILDYIDHVVWDFNGDGDLTGDETYAGHIIIKAPGKTLKLRSAVNGAAGTFTANGATAVVVNTTVASITMVVATSLKSIGGTPGGAPFVSAIVAGTSFSMKAAAGDTSVYNYVIFGLV